MKVRLLAFTPNGETICGAAASLCYSDVSVDELPDQTTGADEKLLKLLKKVIGLGHHSVIEHASLTFAIEGISRACSHQLVRHRIASFSQQSQRYVSFDNIETVTPESIEGNPKMKELFDELKIKISDTYSQMLDEGVPAEDARFVLPNAATTKLVMTMNCRELIHFFTVRCCERAQWEAREAATQMLLLAKRDAYPNIFADAGPGCLRGSCPEGAMTCGRIGEVRAKFGK